MEQDPQPLDYQRPAPPPLPQVRRRMNWRWFGLGLAAGIGFSVVYYILIGLEIIPIQSVGFALGAVILKFSLGFALLFVDGWRAFGIGLIASVPLAVLIFVGVCFGLIAIG